VTYYATICWEALGITMQKLGKDNLPPDRYSNLGAEELSQSTSSNVNFLLKMGFNEAEPNIGECCCRPGDVPLGYIIV
jgi:hypothetical protein